MNPWLTVPPAEYEAHMAHPAVGQLDVLARLLADDLERCRPKSLVVVGCATGNGFEHIDPAVTTRVVALDLNPAFLALLASRHAARLRGLQLLQADLMMAPVQPESADLVHAGLVLEYAAPRRAILRMARWLRPGGTLSVVLQLPSERATPIASTPFVSLQALASIMCLVDEDEVNAAADVAHLQLEDSRLLPLPQGKALRAQRYRRP